jgi:hypothetical protein
VSAIGAGGDERVPLERLIDTARLTAGRRAATRAEIQRALPRGWVLEEDGLHARRDARLLFREGWVILAGLVVFGAAVLGLFFQTFPRGWRGVARALALAGVLLVLGGWIAPRITRALYRR